jgi:hypothetical protein
MKTLVRTKLFLILAILLAVSPVAAEEDLRNSLRPGEISSMRVNLSPAGGGLGFELEIDGGDRRLAALIGLIRGAEPGGGHKCPNEGAIRFFMRDGSVVGIGLLPGHAPGEYGLRLYEGERLLGTYLVDRDELLVALDGLGVPTGDPAFRE